MTPIIQPNKTPIVSDPVVIHTTEATELKNDIREIFKKHDYSATYGWREREDIVEELDAILKHQRQQFFDTLRELHDYVEETIVKLTTHEKNIVSSLELNGAPDECMETVHKELPEALVNVIRLEDRINEIRASGWR